MPLSAAASAREILTGLHDVMAGRGSAQSKLDKVVDLIAAKVATEGRSLNLAEAAEHPAFAYRPETGEESFHSFAGVPIVRLESPIGVLAVQHAAPRGYEEVEIEALQTVALGLSEM